MDIVSEILIAELHRQGVLDAASLQNIARRLEETGEPVLAREVLGVVIGNALDTPEARRSAIHSINGGNDP